MDNVAKYNQERWAALVRANAVFTRPQLTWDAASAREFVDREGRLGDLHGKRVLCLASGGGQQSAAFALLGAAVTVVDLSAEQLQGDRAAAAHYGHVIETIQGDMRDLSGLYGAAFDVVYHPYSLNFVPDARAVFVEVAQVLRAGGVYYLNCANPCFAGLLMQEWDGHGYPLRRPYVDGLEIRYADEPWVFLGEIPQEKIDGPVEYRHTLGTLINGLIEQGFVLLRAIEERFGGADFNAEPGTFEHFTAVAPYWLQFWAVYQPGLLAAAHPK
jgi:SAM-dependent methyltransferase